MGFSETLASGIKIKSFGKSSQNNNLLSLSHAVVGKLQESICNAGASIEIPATLKELSNSKRRAVK